MRKGKKKNQEKPSLTIVVTTLAALGKTELPRQLARWLDALDETGRWALLKLVTGGLRIGVSARLAKTAVAALGDKDADEIELLWPALAPPYLELFAWLEGRADKPAAADPAPFRPVMLAHAIEDSDLRRARSRRLHCRMEMGRHPRAGGRRRGDRRRLRRAALFAHRRGHLESFPDLAEALRFDGAIDGELLIMRERRVQSFNVLQQRLNRKTVTAKLLAEFPAHLRAYDLLAEGEEDLREQPFAERRARLEALRRAPRRAAPRPLAAGRASRPGTTSRAARADPAAAGAGVDAEAVEGVMLKRRDAPYVPGRPKGPWWKWKRDPFIIDAVLMYAQRGHGKRSSFYSDYTFGVWTRGEDGDELVPVGKAYFGFTDEELSRSTATSAATPSTGSARCARSCTSRTRASCLRSRSRACSARPGTNPASRCGSRASAGCAGTSRRAKPTGWSCWRR